MTMFSYKMFETLLPLPLALLTRMPFAVPSIVRFVSVTLCTPPEVSDPIETPCPCPVAENPPCVIPINQNAQ
jgi:hypothetical protein